MLGTERIQEGNPSHKRQVRPKGRVEHWHLHWGRIGQGAFL